MSSAGRHVLGVPYRSTTTTSSATPILPPWSEPTARSTGSSSALRSRRLLRRVARERGERVLAHWPGRPRRTGDTSLPPRDPRPRHRLLPRRRGRTCRRLHAAALRARQRRAPRAGGLGPGGDRNDLGSSPRSTTRRPGVSSGTSRSRSTMSTWSTRPSTSPCSGCRDMAGGAEPRLPAPRSSAGQHRSVALEPDESEVRRAPRDGVPEGSLGEEQPLRELAAPPAPCEVGPGGSGGCGVALAVHVPLDRPSEQLVAPRPVHGPVNPHRGATIPSEREASGFPGQEGERREGPAGRPGSSRMTWVAG
jgi:hypothetical protein